MSAFFDDENDENDENKNGDGDGDGEDYELHAERAAFERVGKREELGDRVDSVFNSGMDKSDKMQRIQRILMEASLSPTDRFLMIAGAFAKHELKKSITGDTKAHIERLVDLTPHIKYKNPASFILGYFIIDFKDGEINEKKIKEYKKYCTESITELDMIRYARLISSISSISKK
jgi:hypothetical protein